MPQHTKKPISFRIDPELYEKFKTYCKENGINQTAVFERWIKQMETDPANQSEPLTLANIDKRLRALEAKFKSGQSPRPNKQPDPPGSSRPANQIDSDAEYIPTRTAAYMLGYPNSKNLSSYMSKSGFEGIRQGKGKAWRREDVHAFAQERNRPLREVEAIPEDYE